MNQAGIIQSSQPVQWNTPPETATAWSASMSLVTINPGNANMSIKPGTSINAAMFQNIIRSAASVMSLKSTMRHAANMFRNITASKSAKNALTGNAILNAKWCLSIITSTFARKTAALTNARTTAAIKSGMRNAEGGKRYAT